MKKGMIKLSVLYQNGEEKTFDMEYYLHKHIPLVKGLLGGNCIGVAVDNGLSSLDTDTSAPYLVCGHLYFDSIADLQKSVYPNLEQMVGDIPNFTNTQPVVQIAEVVM